jgi:hypothetical protein
MGVERVALGLTEDGVTKTLEGVEVVVERLGGTVVESAINGTAFHEACHSLAAMLLNITVLEATDIPSGDYSGATWVTEYDPTVVAAAEAMGCDGTGHDMWTIAANGDDPDAAVASARALLTGHMDSLNAVASSIQDHGLVSGQTMAEARTRISEDLVEVTIKNPDGTLRTELRTLRGGELYLSIPREYPDVKS